jgi:hypothetical protein
MRVINYKKIFETIAKDRPKHSAFSPSASDKWLVCEGYYHATKSLPATKSGKAALRGTEAHTVLEQCLLFNKAPEEVTKDIEIIDWIGYALDFTKSYKVLHPNAKLFSEVYFPWLRVSGGTVDIVGVSAGEIMIADLKTGFQYVPVENNTQLLSYAVSARKHLGKKQKYRLVIIQPGSNEPVREWVITDTILNEFETKAIQSIINNLIGGERIAGDHCKWCRASAVCETRANFALGQIDLDLRNDFLGET